MLCLNHRWKEEAHFPGFTCDGAGVDFALRLEKVVARRVESRVKFFLAVFRAADAPKDYSNVVFLISSRRVLQHVLHTVGVVEGEVRPAEEVAQKEALKPLIRDGEAPWDVTHPHIIKFGDGDLERLRCLFCPGRTNLARSLTRFLSSHAHKGLQLPSVQGACGEAAEEDVKPVVEAEGGHCAEGEEVKPAVEAEGGQAEG
eukprot:438885-Amphidinium_carterae.1